MIFAAARDLNIDLSRSTLIGDKESDMEAGRRAGVAKQLYINEIRVSSHLFK